MRTLVLALAAGLIAAPAMAQHSDKAAKSAATGQRSDASATAPAHWTGTAAEWSSHANACAARHKSYNAATDKYRTARGLEELCTIQTPMAGPSTGATGAIGAPQLDSATDATGLNSPPSGNLGARTGTIGSTVSGDAN